MQILKSLLPLLRPYRWHMVTVVVSTIGVTAMNLVNPWLIRNLVRLVRVDGVNNPSSHRYILYLALSLLGAYILRAVFQFLTSYVAHHMAWNFVSDLRSSIYQHLQRLSLRYYHDRQTGEILSRVVNDTAHIEPLIAHNIPDLIVNGLILAGIAVILFTLNPGLAALTLIPMPFLAILVLGSSNQLRPAFRSAQQQLGDLNALLQDNFSGMKEIQIFTREQREQVRVHKRSGRYTGSLLHALRLMAVYHPAIELTAALGTVIVVWFGGRAVLSGGLHVEDLVAFVLYLGMFYQPITLLARMNEQLQQAMASTERVQELLQVQPEIAEPPSAIDPGRLRGEITFENVSFEYVPGVPVLSDINLTIPAGHTLALVGPTGVGKSTIASLIPRFYDPKQGRLLIDGIPIKEMRLATLRQNVSMVLQDVFLFNGTVRENIRYGNPHATDADVITAAKVAGAHDFIEALPQGYDTQIGERGVKLSGGQKQRLSIARAVLKDAPILILDEATSAVDTETETRIQQALERLMQGRTAIVIAHRLSTVRNAHAIAVLGEGGTIVEYGTHDELLAQNGVYRRLHDRQVMGRSAA